MVDEPGPGVIVGLPGGEHVTVRVLTRRYPDAEDFWDGNWLDTMVEFRVGQFSGTVGTLLRADELQSFRRQIHQQHTSLGGTAVLESLENWLTLRLRMTGSGGIEVDGELIDQPGYGNKLTFTMSAIDQSYLPRLLDELDEVLTHFPVRGTP
jgi:hypothetical protein